MKTEVVQRKLNRVSNQLCDIDNQIKGTLLTNEDISEEEYENEIMIKDEYSVKIETAQVKIERALTREINDENSGSISDERIQTTNAVEVTDDSATNFQR